MKKSETKAIVEALEVIALDIDTGDGVASACLMEAAERLLELESKIEELKQELSDFKEYR